MALWRAHVHPKNTLPTHPSRHFFPHCGAQQLTAQALHSTRRLNLAEMAGSLRALTTKDGGALVLTEADEGSAALRAYSEASEAQLDAVRAGTDRIIKLCVPRLPPAHALPFPTALATPSI